MNTLMLPQISASPTITRRTLFLRYCYEANPEYGSDMVSLQSTYFFFNNYTPSTEYSIIWLQEQNEKLSICRFKKYAHSYFSAIIHFS
eukprot:UN28334